jgi:multidrug efflux pump subunit AcrA (membrane-fusion protein)
MKRHRTFLLETVRVLLPILIVGVGVGGLLVFGQRPEVPQRQSADDPAVLVQTAEVHPFDATVTIEVEGVAVPFRQVTLAAEVAGRITTKSASARAGSYVHEDDVLIQIDETDYSIEVERLESRLKQAEEDLVAADVDIASSEALIALAREEVALRRTDLERNERLAERDSISESEAEEARRLELTARNALQTLENQLAAARQRRKTLEAARDLVQVELRRAQVDLERTRVGSPVTGTVVTDHVEEDDYIKKGDPLLAISETSRMEVKCNLRVEELYWVWLESGNFVPGAETPLASRYEIPQTPVQVVFTFEGTEYVWDGVLSRYEGSGLDPDTRTVPCRVLIDQPTRVRISGPRAANAQIAPPTLFAGMYVKIRIPVNPPLELLRIPLRALRPGGQVWVVRDGRLEVETVEVGRVEDAFVLVRAGALEPGEKVVTSPLATVQSGMPVREVSTP